MALKKIKPTTPGQRHKIIVTNDDITTSKPEKSLVCGYGKSGGRKSSSSRGLRPGMERVQRKTDASGRTTTTVTFEQPHVDNSIKTPQQQKKSAVGGLKFK